MKLDTRFSGLFNSMVLGPLPGYQMLLVYKTSGATDWKHFETFKAVILLNQFFKTLELVLCLLLHLSRHFLLFSKCRPKSENKLSHASVAQHDTILPSLPQKHRENFFPLPLTWPTVPILFLSRVTSLTCPWNMPRNWLFALSPSSG